MNRKIIKSMKTSYNLLLRDNNISDIKITDLKFIGDLFNEKIAELCGLHGDEAETVTVGHFHAYLRGQSESEVTRIIRKVFKNQRANSRVFVKSGAETTRVVDDVNHFGFMSIITFLHTLNKHLCGRGDGGRRREEYIAIDYEYNIMMEHSDISKSARMCRALSLDRCRAAGNHCKSRGDMCVPKRENVKAPISDGINSGAKRDQRDVPYAINTLNANYAHGWRRVGPLRAA